MNNRFRIMAVDDESINIKLITSALKDKYEIFSATNGYDAISQIKEHKPDLILLDVMMPDLNGFEVCRIIKSDEAFADIPVVFLTALNDEESEHKGLEIGGIDYITKPINFSLLKLRVRNHIALKVNIDLVKQQRDLLSRKNEELKLALARVKQLEGIIPICMYCKKIRDDQNSWNQLEEYITEHSEAQFSHSACPDCLEEQLEIIKKMQ